MSNPNEKVSSIRAKLKFPNLASFVERYAPNVSTAGIFVKTPAPKPVGTRVKFEFLIADGTAVMRGLGQVAWVRETEADDRPVGMGIKFLKLDAASRAVLDRIIDFKHSLGGPPTPSRYSEMPPPYVPEGTDVDEEEAEDDGADAPVDAEPPRETPPPAPPPTNALVPPPPPAAHAEEPPRAETGPKKKHRPKPANVDLSAIDSMLADLAAPPADAARKRRKTGEHAVAAQRPAPSPAAPAAEPAPPAAPEFHPTEPAPPAAPEIPADEPEHPVDEPEAEASELDLDSALTEARESESLVREELREELEALEGPPPVVLREPPAVAEGKRATGEIRNLIADELATGDLVDLLEPEERKDHLAALSEPPAFAGEGVDAPIRFAPGQTVSFMPPPPSEADSLEEDFESVIGGADADGDGEVGSPTAALTEDSGVTDLGEDAVIAGAMGEDGEAQGDFEILDEESVGDEAVAESGPADVVDSLIAEMARDSRDPDAPTDLPLLEDETVSDALDNLFDESGPRDRAVSHAMSDAPETLPDDAVPPGLVRDRPARRPVPPPPPEPSADAASKKKGFFGKLFGK
jgi:uncharacterized protein (TIGR02266 family)